MSSSTQHYAARFLAWLTNSTLLLLVLLLSCTGMVLADDEFLQPEAAFMFSARMQDARTIAVTYDIADGYYMYRERFKFDAGGARLGTPVIPAGKVKFDTTFQKNVETYRHSLTVLIPVETSGAFTLISSGQGCSDKGLCYAPLESKAALVAGGAGGEKSVLAFALPQESRPAAVTTAAQVDTPVATREAVVDTSVAIPARLAPLESGVMGGIAAALQGGKLLVILPLFLVLGLGLSLTPCVLPMVPILSFIIVGEGAKVRRARAFALSLAYVLGMAIVYTALGVAAGLIGEGLAARLQNPWVLGVFALLMAALALSMFGVYELQVPAAVQQKLAALSNRQSSGKLAGVFLMGAFSALIVGPCVAGPLAGVLVYISQSGNAVVGGAALFAMALGMGVPLLLLGMSAGALLPRAGLWMEAIKRFFGVLLLATAWWLLAPVLPPAVQMLGWSTLGIAYGMFLLSKSPGWAAKSVGVLATVLGVMQLLGAVSGGRDALAPLAHLQGAAAQVKPVVFMRVKTVAQLDAALLKAGAEGKTTLLDFYADWCVSCKEMDKLTFIDAPVRAKMATSVLLQVDVTANDDLDKAMLKRFQLFGPPGIIMFDRHGQEVSAARVIGYQDAPQFLASLARLD